MLTLIAVPGIGAPANPKPQGILKLVADVFPPSKVVSEQFNYRNNYGPVGGGSGQAYDENLVDAVRSLAQRIRECPNNVILVGYSAGAHVVSILLEEMARGLHKDLIVSGVVLIANPLRGSQDRFAPNVPPAPGWGVAGQHGAWPRGLPFVDVANPADIICCSDPNSPVRGFSNVTRSFSASTPQVWAAKYLAAARAGKNQQWFNPFAGGAFTRAIMGVSGYLSGVEHGSWYVTSGLAKRGGEQLRALLRL